MTGPLIDFTKPRADNRKFLREITTWVEDRLPDSMDDVTVMVNEMQCFEPGCPPLETVVRRIVEAAPDSGVSYLTLYAFSTENWKRSSEEVQGLLELFSIYIRREGKELKRRGARVRFIGEPNPHGSVGMPEPTQWSTQRYWAADGVHPSDEGYRVWGEHIGTAIVRQAMLAGGPSAGP